MLTATRTHGHGAVVTLFAELRTRLAAGRRAARRAQARRASARALAGLPDHILRDIGRERDGASALREDV